METFRHKDEKEGREENATRTEYNNKTKQGEPIPELLLGGLYISDILAAPISLLRTHVLFYRKKNYQAYGKLF